MRKPEIGGFPRVFEAWLCHQVGAMMPDRSDRLVPLIPRLRRRARRLCASQADAEDILQDTLLTLCQRLKAGAAVEDLNAYAMRTLSNRARANWRRDAVETLEDDMAVTVPDALLRLDCADTLDAIAALPEAQRRLMQMVVAGDTSPSQIAAKTGLPLGTVMSRLARARRRLRQILAEDRTDT